MTSVRTYAVNASGGLRAEVGVSGAAHNCGTDSSTYYFDSDKIGLDAVKSVVALSLTAQTTERAVEVTFDCAYGGGYGWGVALMVAN